MLSTIKEDEIKLPSKRVSDECIDFISKLLVIDPNKRLGSKGGSEEVLAHPWLSSLDHQLIEQKKMMAEVKPNLSKDKLDLSNFDTEFTGLVPKESSISASKVDNVKKN